MKRLLDGNFAPVTDRIGFLEAPFEKLVKKFSKWFKSLEKDYALARFECDLDGALRRLEPLNLWPQLLVETQSDWVAVFHGTGDPGSPTRYNAKTLPCRGVLVKCVEDSYDEETGTGRAGAVHFCAYGGPDADSVLNVARLVEAVNADEGWEFWEEGKRLSFEEPEHYQARRIQDRFTPEMLERYCAALGIRLFDESFYGPRCALFHYAQPLPPEVEPETYEMAQNRLGIR